MTLAKIGFLNIQMSDMVDIALVSVLFYYLILLFSGTRATQMVLGIVAIVMVYLLATWAQLNTIVWLMSLVWKVGIIALVIVFQPELRGGLTKIGTYGLTGVFSWRHKSLRSAEEVSKAAIELSKRGFGGLIVIEREVGLTNYIETGKNLMCAVNSELLISIFYPNAPMHDGAVIIRGETIVAAGCALPLTQNPSYDYLLGMRHRAAVGISSESDAITVVVSEETGSISIASNSHLRPNIPAEKLQDVLEESINSRT
jgi:diadenylate cyclase